MEIQYEKDIEKYFLPKSSSIKQAIRQMKKIGEKVLFVVDDDGRKLFGSLSDGDIRKWILAEKNLDDRVDEVCNKTPKCVDREYEIKHVKKLMLNLKIENIPVVDDQKQIVDVLVWDKVFRNGIAKPKGKISIPVVIMAGGKGTRLDPFTRVLPKPLIPIGNKTIIEIIMDKFFEYGVSEFYVSVNHKAHMLKAYFKEMVDRYKIHYLEEEKPLGTAGSLRLLAQSIEFEKTIVTNCDILIDADLSEIVSFHEEEGYDMTLVASCRNFVIPYGVCHIVNGGELESITEKPEYDLLVNTGMYVIGRRVLDIIPENEMFHATDLIERSRKHGFRIGVFPVDEKSWIDVGQWEEYHKTIRKFSAQHGSSEEQ